MARKAPLLIQRELLLDGSGQPVSETMDSLIRLLRGDRPVWLVAEQASGWRPTRRSVDLDLVLQQQIHQWTRRAGAALDGVLYLPEGLFVRRRRRNAQLDDLASRYDVTAADLTVIARDAGLLETLVLCGGRALAVGEQRVEGATQLADLEAAIALISKQ